MTNILVEKTLTLNAKDDGIWILHVGFTNAKNCFFCVSSHAGCYSLYTQETFSDIKYLQHRCIRLHMQKNCMIVYTKLTLMTPGKSTSTIL